MHASMASKQKEEPPASTASIEEDARDEESEGETASPVFNVDKLKAETKTPFRKVRGGSNDKINKLLNRLSEPKS